MTARSDSPDLDPLAALAAETIRLGPLPDRAAVMVIRRASPGLDDADVRRVLARAGGNPLMLEEIVRDGRVSPSIARAIAAQLEAASPAARRSLMVLAIADRPMALAPFESVLDELERLGIVAVEGGMITIRHRLIAEALTVGLSADDRAAVHAAVAELIEGGPDQALHLALAGRPADAMAVAERALADTWDMRRRLALLRFVAGLAVGPDPLSRRLDAARLATDLEEPLIVLELLDQPVSGDPGQLAIRDALLARAFGDLGQQEAAERARGRCRVGCGHDPTGEASHRLALELALERTNVGDIGAALEILEQADIDGAAGDPAYGHRRAVLRSFLRFLLGEPPDFDGMRAALDDALRDRNAGPALSNSQNLHNLILANDGPAPALAFSREATQRLEAAGIDAWRMRCEAVQDLTFVGLPAEAVVIADELLEQPLPPETLTWTLVLRAEALLQLGRFGEASASLARAELVLTDGWHSRGEALTTEAAIALWSGRPRDALAAAERALAIPTFYAANHMLTALTRAWAAVELGRSPGPLPDAHRGWMVDGARAEWAALRARSLGEPSRDQFLRAAALWDGRLAFRATLCRWAAADAARLIRAAEAAALLRDVLDEAERMGFEPIARRVRRSLRVAGVRVPRAAPPVSGTSLLTPREHEILGLVGDGLANIEIARRMGLGRPTVARIVSNAMSKLGAESRAQAVALAHASAG